MQSTWNVFEPLVKCATTQVLLCGKKLQIARRYFVRLFVRGAKSGCVIMYDDVVYRPYLALRFSYGQGTATTREGGEEQWHNLRTLLSALVD